MYQLIGHVGSWAREAAVLLLMKVRAYFPPLPTSTNGLLQNC